MKRIKVRDIVFVSIVAVAIAGTTWLSRRHYEYLAKVTVSTGPMCEITLRVPTIPSWAVARRAGDIFPSGAVKFRESVVLAGIEKIRADRDTQESWFEPWTIKYEVRRVDTKALVMRFEIPTTADCYGNERVGHVVAQAGDVYVVVAEKVRGLASSQKFMYRMAPPALPTPNI